MYLMESKTWSTLFENWQKKPSDLSRQFSQLLVSSKPYGKLIFSSCLLGRIARRLPALTSKRTCSLEIDRTIHEAGRARAGDPGLSVGPTLTAAFTQCD